MKPTNNHLAGLLLPLEFGEGPKLWEAESGDTVTLHGIFHLGACGRFPHDSGCIEVKGVGNKPRTSSEDASPTSPDAKAQ